MWSALLLGSGSGLALEMTLGELLPHLSKVFTYTYDFGDDWIHSISLVKISEPDNSINYPICILGGMACPPEDSGGPHGYERIKNPKNRQEVIDWLGKPFDAHSLDLGRINKALARKFIRPKKA